MKTKFYALAVVLSLFVSMAGCGKSLKKLEDLATELRIHNRNIAKLSNEFHSAGRMADSRHKTILTAADKFSTALDAADAAIETAKLVKTKIETKAALDYAERLIDTEVFRAFVGIVEAVVDVPPDIKEKIEEVITAIRIIFAAIRALLADAGAALKQEDMVQHAE